MDERNAEEIEQTGVTGTPSPAEDNDAPAIAEVTRGQIPGTIPPDDLDIEDERLP